MDFIGGLPKAAREDTIMGVLDQLTKYAHFVAISHPFSAKGGGGRLIHQRGGLATWVSSFYCFILRQGVPHSFL